MNRQQHDELYDMISAAHWNLWGILAKVERGTHRMLIANADEALVEILKEMQDTRPEGLSVVKEGGR